MSNKERLEFLYDPKALLEYDNEKYLLGKFFNLKDGVLQNDIG